MATRSRPLPADPYHPIPSEGLEVVRYPSPFVPLRLPIFRTVILMNDLIVRVLSVGAGGKRSSSPSALPSSASSKYGRKGEGLGSADGFDIIEEGGDTETVKLHASTANRPMPTPSVAVRQRVNIRRKKLD
jgi:hypothetical protein